MTKEYCTQWYASKFDNLDKKKNFLRNHGLKYSTNPLTLPSKCGAQFPSPLTC